MTQRTEEPHQPDKAPDKHGQHVGHLQAELPGGADDHRKGATGARERRLLRRQVVHYGRQVAARQGGCGEVGTGIQRARQHVWTSETPRVPRELPPEDERGERCRGGTGTTMGTDAAPARLFDRGCMSSLQCQAWATGSAKRGGTAGATGQHMPARPSPCSIREPSPERLARTRGRIHQGVALGLCQGGVISWAGMG